MFNDSFKKVKPKNIEICTEFINKSNILNRKIQRNFHQNYLLH